MKPLVKVVIVSVLMALAAVYVYVRPPERMALDAGSLAAFPIEFDGWSGADRGFEEVVYEELAADDTLARSYVRGDERVWFVIVFHQNERYGAHEPLVCYRSHGWGVAEQGTRRLRRREGDFDANWVLVERGGERRLALYWWYTAGDLATGDRDQFLARMAKSGILSNVTFGAFIRVSTAVPDEELDGAFETVTGFAEGALEHLGGLFAADEQTD